MLRNKAKWVVVVVIVAGLNTAALASFSIDSASPTSSSYDPADVLSFDGDDINIVYSAAELGLTSSTELMALSGTYEPPDSDWVMFSVDRPSIGEVNTDVRYQSTLNQEGGDLYLHEPGMLLGHELLANQDGFGLVPLEDADYDNLGNTLDNLDAFSAAAGTAYFCIGAADILWSDGDGSNAGYAGADDIGLQPGDIIDGLTLLDTLGDRIIGMGDKAGFSLAPGSPSLGTDSPADIFITHFDGSYGILFPAESLGLDPDVDNVDAVRMIPEPMTIGIFFVGGLAMISRRRRN